MSQAASLQRDPSSGGGSPASPRLRGAVAIVFICFLTFGALWTLTELSARRLFANSSTTIWSCFVPSGQSSGIRAIPNSVCLEKLPESPLIEYRFNACGYRTEARCGPKPPGSLRVVVVGSSYAMGYQVPYEHTFAALLGPKLTAAAGRKVEIDNQGMLFGTPRRTSLYFEEALNAHPDLILWTLGPWDIENVSQTQDVLPLAKVDREGGPPPPKLIRFFNAFRDQGVVSVIRGSRSVLMIRHMLYQSRTQYLRSFVMESDSAGIFATHPSRKWEKRWADLDAIARDMAGRAHAAGVPFVITAVPDLAGALMASGGDWPDQFNPFTFGEQVRSLAQKYDGIYLDMLRSFRRVPDIGRFYYTVDGHMNIAGHEWIAPIMAESMIGAGLLRLGK